ncbi:MAG: LexA family transcriptional regulator [Oscillospiraceae bacterium]|nr:LexA family transcriptional regulator [Oscillospiraceae bacterium]
MSTIGSRIRARRIELGLSQDELGKKLGYKSRSSINKIELNQRNLTQSKIKAIADALDTTPAYIMGWEQPDSPSVPLPSNLVPLQPMKQIPLLGQIACGSPILAAENIEEYIDLPRHIKADYALTCKGDSMIGAGIQDGDVVYIRKQEEVENGQIAAVMVGEEEATLKRFYFDGTVVQLVAENSRYSPQFFVEEDAALIHVIGLAVAFTHAIRHYS